MVCNWSSPNSVYSNFADISASNMRLFGFVPASKIRRRHFENHKQVFWNDSLPKHTVIAVLFALGGIILLLIYHLHPIPFISHILSLNSSLRFHLHRLLALLNTFYSSLYRIPLRIWVDETRSHVTKARVCVGRMISGDGCDLVYSM